VDKLNRDAGFEPDSPSAPYQERWFPGVHCGVGGGGDFRALSDQSLVWVWDGAQKAGLALDTDRGSKLYELAPDPHSPVSPFDEDMRSWWQRRTSVVMDALWRRGDRCGPGRYSDISISARRCWKFDPATRPERRPYRPASLNRFAEELDKAPAPPPPPEPGTFDIVRVGPNETLAKIAQEHLGDAERWKELFDLNEDVLEDADHIYPGRPLRVPKR
jgi:LysM repeat protein